MKIPKFYYKYKGVLKALFFCFLFFAVICLFSETNNPFKKSIEKIDLPVITQKIKNYMDSQAGESYNSFDWYTFYEAKTGKKVSVKYSGSVNWHHSPLLNRSINYKIGQELYRMKSFTSESVPDNSFDNPFISIFSEFSTYNIVRKESFEAPISQIVSVNDDPEQIMIRWEDSFVNSVRELDAVEFNKLTQAFLYADNKEAAFRYFDEYWKDKDNLLGQDLKDRFMQMLSETLYYFDKEISGDLQTSLNKEDYIKFLALASIFGSEHMEIHNLVFRLNSKSNQWSPVVYDFMGSFTKDGRDLSPFVSLNYFSEFFLRHPKYYYDYLKNINILNNQILAKNKLSNFYDLFACKNVSQYDGIQKILQLGTASSYSVAGDLNGFCQAVNKVKNYETFRNVYLEEQLANASLHWNTWFDNKKEETFLTVWNPASTPVKLNNIYCQGNNCSDFWELTNVPVWEFDKKIISPQMVRMPGGYSNAGIPTSVVPQPYFYIYKWKGSEFPKKITFDVVNAVNKSKIFAVKDEYPILITTDNKNAELNDYQHKLKIEPYNFVGSEFVLNPDSFVDEDTINGKVRTKKSGDWKIETSSATCEISGVDFFGYNFDCSKIDQNKWPYLLDYSIKLTYKGVKIRELKGEFFQNYKPTVVGSEIKTSEFAKFEVLPSRFFNEAKYLSLIEQVTDVKKKEELKSAIFKQKKIYWLPVGTVLNIKGDLDLGDAVLFIEDGSTLTFGPLAKLSVGVLLINGKPESKVRLDNLEGLSAWSGIELSPGGGGYLNYVNINNTANINNGAIGGEDIAYLKIQNTNFETNSSGIKCANCLIDVSSTSFNSNRWFRVEAWAINTANSEVIVENFSCVNLTNCIISSDDNLSVSNLKAEKIRASVFLISGASGEANLKDLTIKEAASFITKQYFPKINYDKSKINFEKVNYSELIDLDDSGIYNDLSNDKADTFYKKNKNFLKPKKGVKNAYVLSKNLPVIKNDMVIPEEVTLEILPGTILKLENNISIISYGKIIAKGNEQNKISFISGDRHNKSWGTVLLRGDKAIGEFDNCVFKNGGGDYLVGFDYTGSLTAHDANSLIVTNSLFEKNKNDDALNCKYSKCLIFNNVFKSNAMDAIDFDFADSSSEIGRNVFENNGNDSIDLSSSNVKVYENQMISSGDKGVSVGENSNPLIFNNLFKNNNIGIEAKDGSTVLLINNDFVDNKLHLNGYQKKKRFYRGGLINAYNNLYSGTVGEESRVDNYSKIVINREISNEIRTQALGFYDLSKITYGLR